MNWQKEIYKDRIGKFLLFLVSPFLGFLYALKNINTKSSFCIFFLFAVFFGINFTTSIGRDETHRGDAAQYRMKYEYAKSYSTGELSDIYQSFSSLEDERTRDIYIPIMSVITAKISDNYHVFFMLLAIVFSFFMLRTFKIFAAEVPKNKTVAVWILLYLFAMSNSIFNINGCRFWTAAWIGTYCLFQIYKNGNSRYYLLCCITPAIHSSYWFFLGILLIAKLLGNRTHFWKVAFFASFLISSVSMQLVTDLSDYLPPALQFLVARYTENEVEVKTNLYQVLSRIFNLGWTILMTVMMYNLMKREREIQGNAQIYGLYKLLLVWMTICNFVMPIPSLGGRYIAIGYPIMAYIWIVLFKNSNYNYRILKWYPIVSLMSIYEMGCNYFIYSVPFDFYTTSPIYQVYKYLILGIE